MTDAERIVGWESEELGALCPSCVAYEMERGNFVEHPEGLVEDVAEGVLFQALERMCPESFAYYVTECEGCYSVISTRGSAE